jgi:hypothetical protein
MAKPRSLPLSHGPAARRALVATLALCLFLMQTLLAASIARPHMSPAGAPQGYAASDYCEPHRDGGAPAEREHAPCCILCVAGRDAPPLAPPKDDDAPVLAHPVSSLAPRAYGWTAPPERAPIGWASSWSSRAPPRA